MLRILFVDNHPELTQTVIEVFLREYEVVVVATISAAKERFQGSRFDVLLVDYDLDDGNGAELVTWVRAAGSDAKVVAVSARERGNEALVAAGANVVCAKTSFARIQTVLRDLLETPASPPRVYADFNGLMESPRDPARKMVPLDTWGSLRDLSNAGLKLREGIELLVHDASDDVEDLEAVAVAHYDAERRWWYAELASDCAYVPARNRSPATAFLCLGCRANLGPEALVSDSAIVTRREHCPECGLSILSAIEPPST